MSGSAAGAFSKHEDLIRFVRFCVVGGVVFLVDAGVLLGLVGFGLAGPISGRIIFSLAAVVVTYGLNRQGSFGEEARRTGPPLAPFLAHLAVQGVGFLTKLCLHAGAFTLPSWLASPLPVLRSHRQPRWW